MISIGVGEQENYAEFSEILKNYLPQLLALEVTVELVNEGKSDKPSYVINFYSKKESEGMLANLLSRIAAKYIVSYFLWREFIAEVKKGAVGLEGTACGELIFRSALAFSRMDGGIDLLNMRCGNNVLCKLADVMKSRGRVDIDGFCRFALREERILLGFCVRLCGAELRAREALHLRPEKEEE